MAAQLKVFAKLKNLRRAPGAQGELKKTIPNPNPTSSDPKPNPGSVEVFMLENFSSWYPFPTSKYSVLSLISHMLTSPAALKVHHDGLLQEQPEQLAAETGVPGIQDDIQDSDMAHSNGVHSNGYDEETQTA